MKQLLSSCALAALASLSCFGQSQPCDVKETPCVRFEVLGIVQNENAPKTYMMRIVNTCPDPLKYVVFQLPKGVVAKNPADNSVYTAPSGRQYEVRNANASPFYSIRFKAIGEGISGGASDIFEYTLPPQADLRNIGAMARLSSNQSFETHLTVPDCPPRTVVTGNIQTETGKGIADVEVRVEATTPEHVQYNTTAVTDKDGKYSFLVGPEDAYTVTPFKNDDHLNGVNTFDLVLISKHILGLELLGSPYKIIAADANRSGTITPFDLVELRKLLLNIYDAIPNNTSWRFVDKAFVFPNPANPFETAFPESISGKGPHAVAPVHDFIGLKVGDVSNGASSQ